MLLKRQARRWWFRGIFDQLACSFLVPLFISGAAYRSAGQCVSMQHTSECNCLLGLEEIRANGLWIDPTMKHNQLHTMRAQVQ